MFRKNRRKPAKRTGQFKNERGSHLNNKRRMNKVFPKKRRKLNLKNIFKLILFIIFIVVICDVINTHKDIKDTNDKLNTIIDSLDQLKTDQNFITDKQVELEEKQKQLEISKAEKKAEEERLAKEAEEKAKQEEAIRLAKAEQTKVTSRGGNVSRTSNSYQDYAYDLCINTYGWTENDFQCLVKLWNKESGWNPNAHNSSSGAHGIPQSLPASKMASEGADYYTNGETQIRWGLKYIKGRYGSPSSAWSFWQSHNWY